MLKDERKFEENPWEEETLHVKTIGSWYSDWQIGQRLSRKSLVDTDGKGRLWNASRIDRRNRQIDL